LKAPLQKRKLPWQGLQMTAGQLLPRSIKQQEYSQIQ